jgi:hypothetical protein
MKISEIEKQLAEIKGKHGDINVMVYYTITPFAIDSIDVDIPKDKNEATIAYFQVDDIL